MSSLNQLFDYMYIKATHESVDYLTDLYVLAHTPFMCVYQFIFIHFLFLFESVMLLLSTYTCYICAIKLNDF